VFFVRDGTFNRILGQCGSWICRIRNRDGIEYKVPDSIRVGSRNHKALFTKFYSEKIWGGNSGRSSSKEYTQDYRRFLEDFIREHDIKSVVDLGCGDWQFSKLIDWHGTEYTGFDCVESIIDENKKSFACENTCFVKGDITKAELPPADLGLIKDVLQNWSNGTILDFLHKLRRYKYVLFVNGYNKKNRDCSDGDTRNLDFKAPPFNLDVEEVFSFKTKRVFLMINDS